MKYTFKLMLWGLSLCSTSLFGCDQKEVTDIVVKPTTPPVTTSPKAYYVSEEKGSDANNGLSISTPLKTIGAGQNLAAPGDTVFIMNGNYAPVTTIQLNKSGTEGKYITYKAYAGHKPKFFFSGSIWNAITINGSYIVLEGLEIQGNNQNLTYEEALASYNDKVAGGNNNSLYATYNMNGISIGGPNTESKFPHHVVIRNCKIHDFPGGGLSSIQADYTTFEGNTVYNNAWYMMYGGSGISILTPYDSDANTGYKNIVRNNVCYSNRTTIPWISQQKLSDGNGIIIDVNLRPYNSTVTDKPYKGRTLVENNISYNNGGSGIHAFDAAHVDIINNTAYNNAQIMVTYADIFANTCSDVKIMNNIVYTKPNGNCNSNNKNKNVTYDYNVYFVGKVAVKGPNDKVMDPMFVNLSTDPNVANFSLRSGSPAIDGGTQSIFAPKDIKGVARPKGGTVDCGAYEVQ
ncbi:MULTISPECIES: right-handed parallel beta-helix repeat-containing protein [unclassified Arcicella]|uniref:right-handed parallel beta-helix repeat-containing protein n=1 Tax=unclassified Arcicella TaxID=2644986 RepID=UPI0028583D65|nr:MULTISPECIES: right-handed parallel beta-helix repeat-containing protein [unclassified Arcicella]MDR6562123.1 parallel beta-helix repeat protein [Arcicella sp. BE51]MDR6812182.1 parallel beta-helix repeat protein [Arcicella sp. BE140]MDR6823494.1 parallel beta-helix repeat protein [Arcicella sp. BE139]